MKKSLIALLLLFLSACKKNAIQVIHTDFNNIKLELLFEKDGCKMYRFYDDHYVYWSDCSGRVESQYQESSGKGNLSTGTVTAITD